jgi:hypothetical protein
MESCILRPSLDFWMIGLGSAFDEVPDVIHSQFSGGLAQVAVQPIQAKIGNESVIESQEKIRRQPALRL